jgi:hypothetical protein
MKPDFSAGAPFLGYLYQAQYALYSLLQERRPEAKIVIEGLDDVVTEYDDSITLTQLKHQLQVRKQATMTAASPELWKTINIWAKRLSWGEWKPGETQLVLVTTAKAPADSLPALLCEGKGRDEKKARLLLLDTAVFSVNKALENEFEAFLKLSDTEQQYLIEAMVVYDEAPPIHDLPALIKQGLRYSVLPDKMDAFYERLQSWWLTKVIEHLRAKSQQSISWLDLQLRITDLISRFQSDSLPIDYAQERIDMTYIEAQKDKMFVRQLNCLKVRTERVQLAIEDFYRAFEQRTRWVKDKLLIDDDLAVYEDKLKKEWRLYMAQLKDELDDESELDDDAACIRLGKRVLMWVENVKMPIRKNMPLGDDYVMRGSYHMLANHDTPPVYWHPRFLEQLERVVAEAAV